MDMVPNDDSHRTLKRPRQGSLDTEEHRPPPELRDGGSRSQMRLDMHHQAPSSGATSSVVTGTNVEGDQPYARRAPISASPSQTSGPNSSITQIPSHSSQTNFMGGTYIENHGNIVLNHQTAAGTDALCSAQLQHHAASNAIHTSSAVEDQGICMPGTRAFTLQRLQSLVSSTGEDDPDVIWLHGPAGAGKSAIMRTMAKALEEQNVLLGSFFFFRSDHSRNTSTRFVPTMALQTFTSLPTTKPHIRNGIESQPTIFSQSTRRQLRTLVETPLKFSAGHEPKWTAQTPLVLVVDGLDECAEADRQVDIIGAMRQLTFAIHSSTNHRVKVLIASRPEKPIADEFALDKDSVTIIKLDPSDANIDHFYDTQLGQLRLRKCLPESWPSLRQIIWLREKTSGQYSFAKISTGFLAGGDPIERFKMLEEGVGTHGLEPFEALDALYTTIFRQIPPEMASNALLLVRFWLAEPVFAKMSFVRHLECILSLPSGFSSRILHYLSSIFYHDEPYQYIRPHHASLEDFLGKPSRSQKFSLFLALETLWTTIVDGMLRLCIPPTLPMNVETVDSRLEACEGLSEFSYQITISSRLSRLPNMVAMLNQLPPLLPTMDLYSFGCCSLFLSMLFNHLHNHPDLDPFHSPIVSRLYDQVRSIKQRRFAPYEALEARGDSGFGLFGLLLVYVSDYYILLKEPDGTFNACGVAEMVAYLTQEDQNTSDPSWPHATQEPLPLHTLTRQLSIMKGLVSPQLRCRNSEWWHPPSVGEFALFSRPIEDHFPQLSLCLSRTIEMVLDLPSQKTRIQAQMLRRVSCADHATLHAQCDRCASNLEWMQTSVIYGVIHFLCGRSQDGPLVDPTWVTLDAHAFIRCYHFVDALKRVRVHGVDLWGFHKAVTYLGRVILDGLEQEECGAANVSIINDVQTVLRLSSLKEKERIRKEKESRREKRLSANN